LSIWLLRFSFYGKIGKMPVGIFFVFETPLRDHLFEGHALAQLGRWIRSA
jgi:hypothetical protein